MILAYIPCKDEEEAKRIGKKLVEGKIATCANIIPKMTSYYIWQKKLREENEALLICKTTERKMKLLESKVKKLHSYSVPCIACIKIDKMNKEYERWAKKTAIILRKFG